MIPNILTGQMLEKTMRCIAGLTKTRNVFITDEASMTPFLIEETVDVVSATAMYPDDARAAITLQTSQALADYYESLGGKPDGYNDWRLYIRRNHWLVMSETTIAENMARVTMKSWIGLYPR